MKTIVLYDDYNRRFHPGSDVIGCVRQTFGNLPFTNGWKLIEIYESKCRCVRVPLNMSENGICRTILATYHKIGIYNVFEHDFPAIMEIYEDEGI